MAEAAPQGGVLDMVIGDYYRPQPDEVNRKAIAEALLRYGDKVLVPNMTWSDVGGAALDGLHRIGDVGQAVQSTGGPPGAIIGGVMRGVGHGPAFMARLVRSLTAGGRMGNQLDDAEVGLQRAADAYNKATGQPVRNVPTPRQNDAAMPQMEGFGTTGKEQLLWDTNIATNSWERALAEELAGRKRGMDQFSQRPADLARPQLDYNPAGTRAFNDNARAQREAGVQQAAHDRMAIQSREAERAQREAPRMQRQEETARIDEAISTMIGRSEGRVRSDMPAFIEAVSQATGAEPWKVIRAMTDRGYDLSGLTQRAFQGNPMGPLTGETRALWDMVRMDKDTLYRKRKTPYDLRNRLADELVKTKIEN